MSRARGPFVVSVTTAYPFPNPRHRARQLRGARAPVGRRSHRGRAVGVGTGSSQPYAFQLAQRLFNSTVPMNGDHGGWGSEDAAVVEPGQLIGLRGEAPAWPPPTPSRVGTTPAAPPSSATRAPPPTTGPPNVLYPTTMPFSPVTPTRAAGSPRPPSPPGMWRGDSDVLATCGRARRTDAGGRLPEPAPTN